jgi:beta-xylosidase
MMRYKNPLFFKENDKFDLGDPFVFRYNGDYYLFHTSHVPPVGIRVYVSHDLIDWDYRGFAATDEKAIGGFAPEIIYAYNRFYMCTSPLGKGHYIFSSDKPEGPYKRITDNLESMIDGSFFVTSDAKLHFLRANHHGIATFDMDENGQISNRRNIDVEMGAWTEGPSLIYKDGYYYLFYCGNNYTAKGYRVNYAYSKSIDGPYITGPNEPLLINTDGRYTRLGHSSEVLSPDLLGYQMFYHSLDIHEDGKREGRRIHMDRLHFADGLVNVTPTDYSISSISLPTFEARIKDLPIVDGFALSSKKTS